MFRGRKRRRGQATTEYILIVVLVAVLSIGIITVFGNQIRDLFRVATERMGGDKSSVLDTAGVTDQAAGRVIKDTPDLKRPMD